MSLVNISNKNWYLEVIVAAVIKTAVVKITENGPGGFISCTPMMMLEH